jgi:hypothetical protein
MSMRAAASPKRTASHGARAAAQPARGGEERGVHAPALAMRTSPMRTFGGGRPPRVLRRKCASCAAAEEVERRTGIRQPLCPSCEKERAEGIPLQRSAFGDAMPAVDATLSAGSPTSSAAGGPGDAPAPSSAEPLVVGAADDALEREADHAAERVMAGGSLPLLRPAGTASVARAGDGDASGSAAPPEVHATLGQPGAPLDPATRAFMEMRFGEDFGGVRVHTGGEAEASARAVSAHAYTVGSRIVFGSGRYQPASGDGRRLIAHELAHVVQQRGPSPVAGGPALARSPLRLQRYSFEEECTDEDKKRIAAGHALGIQGTQRAAELLEADAPPESLKAWYTLLFGASGEKNRKQVAANFRTLNKTMSVPFTYHCATKGERECKGQEAEALDAENVIVCRDQASGFSSTGMARLLIHETVRRAQGKRSVTNISDKAGECQAPASGTYGEATTDANHPIPYSCFAEKVLALANQVKKDEADALFKKLWGTRLMGVTQTSYWTGTLTVDSRSESLPVNATLVVSLVGLDWVVSGTYTFTRAGGAKASGEIPFGQLKQSKDGTTVTLTFDWKEGASSGRGYWIGKGSDTLDGKWGYDDSTTSGGKWTMKPT